MTSADGERLQKVLARCGFGSRRACESLISEGRVRVDGAAVRLGARIDATRAVVEVDGVVVGVRPDLVHYLLNKPSGVVTTAHDPQGRPVVTDLVPAEPRVFPVGRLDLMTEGLLVLTNDGDLAHRLTHPSFGVTKEYLAHVSGAPKPAAIRALRQGVVLDDGDRPLLPEWRWSPPTCCASPSMKGAIGWFAGCARRWAIRCDASCGPGSALWPTGAWLRAAGDR